MSNNEGYPFSDLASFRQLDRICDQFEQELKQHGQVKIEDFMARASGEMRPLLLRELLRLELHYRKTLGGELHLEDFLDRFSEEEQIVRDVFSAEASTLAEAATLGHNLERASTTSHGIQIAGYRILDEIARGGMGVVYRAEHLQLKRIVALKMILQGQLAAPEDVERFYTEARALAALEHPGIISIYDIGCCESQHYFSMNYFDGVPLDQSLSGTGTEESHVARILCKVAEAIHYAHSQGVIHRDLKPANILVNAKEEIQIIDFGLSKKLDLHSQATASGQLLGTPHYMSPEQAAGNSAAVGVATDIYALGMLLFRLTTHRFPFETTNLLGLLRDIERTQPSLPSDYNPRLSSALDQICLRCLAKRPQDRYSSAAALAQDLAALANPDSTALPLQTPTSNRSFTPWQYAVGAAALALLTLLGVVFAVQYGFGRLDPSKHEQRADVASENRPPVGIPGNASVDPEVLWKAPFKINQKLEASEVAVSARDNVTLVLRMHLNLTSYTYENDQQGGALPSTDEVNANPDVLLDYENILRGFFEFPLEFRVANARGETLASPSLTLTWDDPANQFLSQTWDPKSRALVVEMLYPLLELETRATDTLDVSLLMRPDEETAATLISGELRLQ